MNKLDKNAQIGVFAEYLLSARHDFLKMKRYKHATIENLTNSISINTSSIERILVELNLQHMKNLVFFNWLIMSIMNIFTVIWGNARSRSSRVGRGSLLVLILY